MRTRNRGTIYSVRRQRLRVSIMLRNLALGSLAVASLIILVLSVAGSEPAGWVLAAVVGLFPSLLIVVAVADRHRLARLAVPLSVLSLLLAGSLLAMLALRGSAGQSSWIAGLPVGLAILLAGIWLLPFVVVIIAYPLTFLRAREPTPSCDSSDADSG